MRRVRAGRTLSRSTGLRARFADDVVAELRRLGRPVEYLLFDNEGHSIRRWRNRLEMWRRIEDTLAGCLGGRSYGFDFYELMPR